MKRTISVFALALGLLMGARNGRAVGLTWTNGNDFWQSTTAWMTNGTGGTGGWPGGGTNTDDGALLTNAGIYTITLTNDVADVGTIDFQNPAGTKATVTLDLGTNSLSAIKVAGAPSAFTVSDLASSTTTVYLISCTNAGKGLFATNATGDARIIVGRSGTATMYVTNGNVTADTTAIGSSGGGIDSTLVLSGANTYYTNNGYFAIAYTSSNTRNGLVVSNSAVLAVGGTFGVGYIGNSRLNWMLLDSGARLSTWGSAYLGNGGSNNTAWIQGGAVWDNGNRSLTIGGTSSHSNLMVIGANSTVVNVSTAIVTSINWLNLNGGLLQVSALVSNFGTIAGYGTIVGNTIIASGAVLCVSNSVGALIFSNNLTLASNATTKVRLGTAFHSATVASNLTLNGTLNITNSPGFTFGSYTLFTYGGSLTTNGTPATLTVGTTPNTNMSYVVDITTSGRVDLVVWGADFSASPTNGWWPLTATFTDTSGSPITNRFWDFGDGTTTNTTDTSLEHTYTTSGSNTVTLTVSGPFGTNILTRANYIVVVNPPHLVVDPASLDYGSVTIGQTNSLSFSVINTGDAALIGTATSAAPFIVTSGDSYNVAVGGTQTVTIAFVPESGSAFNDSVIFNSNGGDSTSDVTGVGLTPGSISVTPVTHDFGVLATGTTAQVSFVVTNSGGTAVSNGTATVTGGPFSVVSGAPFSVPGFGTATVTVQFAPLTVGAYSNAVVFATANGGDVTNAISGTGQTPGNITVLPAVQDFGTLVTGTTAQLSFVVTNSGGVAVSNGTATVTGGPFSIVSGATFSVPGFGSANIAVQFAPLSAGSFSNDVIVATANGGDITNTVTGAAAIVPVASFSGSPTKGASPLVVTFTDSSSGTITNRFWDFGDGTTSNTTATSLDHTYSAGTNTVSLTVSGPVGASAMARTNYIAAGVPAAADFSVSATNGLTLFTVSFTDASSGEITNRIWDFGDGETSNETNPAHTYTNAGTYSVSLTAEGPYGTDTRTRPDLITVYAASVTWTNANVDGNWSDPTSWEPATVPDFGSSVIFAGAGTTATVDSVNRSVGAITFNRSTNFFVGATGGASLTVSNGITVATNFAYTISVPIVLGAANTWSVTDGGALEIDGPVGGTNTITQTGGGTVILTGTNTCDGGIVVSNGTLLVNNAAGSGTGTGVIAVDASATLGGRGVIEGPVVVADGGVFNPGDGVGTLTVSNSLSFAATAVLQYDLGTNSDLTVVSSNLTLAGVLNVADAGGFTNGMYTLFTYGGTLTTNDSAPVLTMGTVPDTNMVYTVDISSNGCVRLLVVIPPPVADFRVSSTDGMVPFTVTFTNTSSGWITNSFWNFGDGATSNTMAVSVPHTYTADGNLSVQLIVAGPGGVSTNTRVGYLAVAPPCDYPLSATNASFGATGGSASVAVTPYTNVCAWTANSNDAWIQIDGGGVSTAGSADVAYTVLPNAASSNSRVGTMTIAGQTFTVVQAGDATPPTVALTAPAPGIVTHTIAVRALATDDVAVARVDFYRDAGVLLGTDTVSPFSVVVNTTTVSDGPHCFYAEARDAAGNVSTSATSCVTVDNNAPSVPTGLATTAVATNEIHLCWSASSDDGSGVAGYDVFRDRTQIAAVSATNYTDSGLATGTEHCYSVAAYDNVAHVSARSAEDCARSFVAPGSLLGTYNGLAIQTNEPTHASSGSLQLVASKTGSFAAKLFLGGKKAAFKGQFDASGNATNRVVSMGPSPVLVILHLDLACGTDQITGTISDGVFTSEVLADRAVYSRANPCPWVGKYTLLLVPPEGVDPGLPQGYGHGTLAVAATGGGKLSVVLSDGTKIKGDLPVSKHGTWPLYDGLYKNQGACIGWVMFGTNDALEATVDWFRPPISGSAFYPAGFTTDVALVGEKYDASVAGESLAPGTRQITLDGGNLTSSIVETVAVDAAGNVSVLPPNNEGLTLTLQLKRGLFSGSFTHPALNETIGFKGAVLQNSNAGAGHFLGTNESGAVILQPTP
ncbi:MAG TPA: PKD domain-containing protein [Verrucomicrobiae bacterium]|nr:PKD domain-containing protein [Verrucomicrobiae bacterium]